MKFHLLAAGLLGLIGLLVWKLLTGFESDLESKRPQIVRESFQRLSRTNSIPLQESDKKYFNPQVDQVLKHQSAAPKASLTPTAEDLTTERLNGNDYWCRPSTPPERSITPIKCVYPNACYGCDNANIIKPEFEGAQPFCSDGSISRIYHVECCPSGLTDGQLDCPSIQECFHADDIPDNTCSCNDRPNCHYVAVGPRIECQCADESNGN